MQDLIPDLCHYKIDYVNSTVNQDFTKAVEALLV